MYLCPFIFINPLQNRKAQYQKSMSPTVMGAALIAEIDIHFRPPLPVFRSAPGSRFPKLFYHFISFGIILYHPSSFFSDWREPCGNANYLKPNDSEIIAGTGMFKYDEGSHQNSPFFADFLRVSMGISVVESLRAIVQRPESAAWPWPCDFIGGD